MLRTELETPALATFVELAPIEKELALQAEVSLLTTVNV
jgi:hypothetical protein